MARRDKPPAPIVKKTPRGLSPVAAIFAEEIMSDPMNTEYDLIKRTRRSNPQNALYWKTLDRVVKATGGWPSTGHLHHDLKLVCGYVYKTVNWETGEVVEVVDSTAFDAMSADEFRQYFDLAMMKLGEHIGFDPLAYQEVA